MAYYYSEENSLLRVSNCSFCLSCFVGKSGFTGLWFCHYSASLCTVCFVHFSCLDNLRGFFSLSLSLSYDRVLRETG